MKISFAALLTAVAQIVTGASDSTQPPHTLSSGAYKPDTKPDSVDKLHRYRLGDIDCNLRDGMALCMVDDSGDMYDMQTHPRKYCSKLGIPHVIKIQDKEGKPIYVGFAPNKQVLEKLHAYAGNACKIMHEPPPATSANTIPMELKSIKCSIEKDEAICLAQKDGKGPPIDGDIPYLFVKKVSDCQDFNLPYVTYENGKLLYHGDDITKLRHTLDAGLCTLVERQPRIVRPPTTITQVADNHFVRSDTIHSTTGQTTVINADDPRHTATIKR